MVITGDENFPLYAVFDPPSIGNFRRPIRESSLFKVEDKDRFYGTHWARYCSSRMDHHSIVNFVVKDSKPITSSSPLAFFNEAVLEDACLAYLQQVQVFNRPEAPIKFSDYAKNKPCSENLVANLAFQQKISVVGPYRHFVPLQANSLMKVAADEPIKLNRLVLYGLIFKGESIYNNNQALAWYQGHLHLIEWDKQKRMWYFLTNLRPEAPNGALIARFLDDNYPTSERSYDSFVADCLDKDLPVYLDTQNSNCPASDAVDHSCLTLFMREGEFKASLARGPIGADLSLPF